MTWRLLCGTLAALAVAGMPVWAQTSGAFHSEREIKTGPTARKQEPSPRKPCTEYGPGFVRAEGSSTCVRIGGGISIGGGVRH
jgi:hypothetical protein